MANQNVNLQTKLLQKLNIFSKMSAKLVILSLLTILYLFAPISVASAFADEPYAYPVCYFNDNGTRVYKWGLNVDDSWFVMRGHWEKNVDTGNKKFVSDTLEKEVRLSCANSQEYYKVAGNPDGIYAAMDEEDSSHDLVYR
ncbi:hypothetical protein [Tolypothrix sp. VBCCA 56010]|uniref:hypothetical protein n=1 Tax=Tolypothrix sp. VBCCA 56010 TaxID=3137731 RepID=UPI003D7DD416